MLSKPRKAKAVSARSVPARKPAAKKQKTVKLSPEFSADEVAHLAAQLERHEQSERAWQRLSAAPEGEDSWSAVEEHLLNKEQQADHAERRWKYFAK